VVSLACPANLSAPGAVCFGAVVGWMTHFTLQRAAKVDTRWLGSIVAILGGATITNAFDPAAGLFGAYAIGLGGAFFIRTFIAAPFADIFFGELKDWQVVDLKSNIRFEGSKAACEKWAAKNMPSAEFSILRKRND